MEVETRTVDFENINQIRNKSVRGLLKKRAKKYESDSDSDAPRDADQRQKKTVQKSSMASAFNAIMSKQFEEPQPNTTTAAAATQDLTLAKYKKKSREADEALAKEEQEKKKRVVKEQRRLLGRILPMKADEEYERGLQIIATRGVVQLFNAVSEYQTNVLKETIAEERQKKETRKDFINATGADKNSGAIGFGSVIDKIKSKQRKWSVLEDDEESAEDGIRNFV